MGRIYQRNKVYYIDVMDRGKRIRKRVGTSKRIAELALHDAEVKIARGELGFDDPELSLKDLFSRFIEFSQTNHRASTTSRYQAVIDHFNRFLKEKRSDVTQLSELKADVIEGYKTFRRNEWVNPNGSTVESEKDVEEYTRRGARARTVNLEVDAIKRILNLAVEWGYLRDNPLKRVKSLKEDDRKPVRFLTADECEQLLEAAPPDVFPILLTFLHTGMRKGELEHLTWGDVDFDRRVIEIRRKSDWNPKSGERTIPISDTLFPVLEEHKSKSRRKAAKAYVFDARGSNNSHNRLRRHLIRTAKKAGIPELTKLHTLRHTFASQLVMSGVDLPSVQRLMGHSSIQTTMIYAHLAPDHLSKAVNKLPF